LDVFGLSRFIGAKDVFRGCPRATRHTNRRRMTISRADPSEPPTEALCKILEFLTLVELLLAVFTPKEVR